jgi:hypothetical protein
MSTHPSSLDLEAFACGETASSAGRAVASHIDDCPACRAFVERVRGALSRGPSKEEARDLVARIAKRPARPARRPVWQYASTVVVPLAAAAALLLFLRTPSTRGVLVPPAPAVSEPSSAAPLADPDPKTTFKGGIPIAVIRDRDGVQERFTGSVKVRPGDRLRVELALDREQAILVGVLGDDGSWLELMEGVRRPATHFSDRSARVDSSPTRGSILVGTPEAVARARATRSFEGVSHLRVEWEGP